MRLPGEAFNSRVFIAALHASINAQGRDGWLPEHHVKFAREVVRKCYRNKSDALPDIVGREDEVFRK